ncbi:MAG: phosphatase PAP2 family protein [Bacilli bacterium]|nr:phosphatase PAP2 family protein [Bacilli bacterium]
MKKLERIIVYSVLGVVFTLVAIFDLQITQALYMPTNIVGRLGELLGEVPLYILGTFAALVLTFYHPSFGKKWDTAIMIIGIIVAAGISIYGGHHTSKLLIRSFELSFNTVGKLLVTIGVAILSFLAAFLGTRKVKAEKHHEAVTWALTLLIMVVCSLLIMQAGKMIWLRPRYRTLVALEQAGAIDSAAKYWLPFYRPQFFTAFSKYKVGGSLGFTQEQINQAMATLHISEWAKEEFYSFPSGHTMNTFVTISICFFPRFMSPIKKEWPKYATISRVVVLLFTLFVAFTRILRGAHNATDVTAGLIFGFVIFDLVSTFFYERFGRQKLIPKMEAYELKRQAQN